MVMVEGYKAMVGKVMAEVVVEEYKVVEEYNIEMLKVGVKALR